jgi:hypothetical protein
MIPLLFLSLFSFVFIMGDLNFRLEGLSKDEVTSAILMRDWPKLMKHDQVCVGGCGPFKATPPF